MAVLNYRELIAWQKAMDVVIQVYRVTSGFPKEEVYALTSQLRRAAVSIPSNIAEGQGRGSAAELVRFLRISLGSLREVETQLLLSCRLNYLSHPESEKLLESTAEVGRLINGLINSLKD